MTRPKYKELYLAEKQRADEWAAKYTELDAKLTESRATALTACKDRANMKADYTTLYQRTAEFLSRFRMEVLSASVEKDGWLYIPALSPEAAVILLGHYGKFNKYVNDTRPPVL